MFQERYNRIVLPFFFLTELFLLLGIYLFTMGLSLFNAGIDLLLISIIWAVPSLFFRSYRAPRTHSIVAALRPQAKTIAIFTFFYFGLKIEGSLSFAFINDIIQFLLSVTIVQFINGLFRYEFFHRYRLSGKNTRNVLLIGSLFNDDDFEKLKKDGLHYGYHILNRIDDINKINQGLDHFISQNKIDLVFLREMDENITKKVSSFCDQYGIRLKLLLNMDVTTGRKVGLDIIGGFPVMDIRKEPLLYLGNRIIKRSIDIIMAICSIIIVLSWLPFIVKFFQMISYPGPLFFIQKRIGRDGQVFPLYKFRTMVDSNEAKLSKEGKSEKTREGDVRVPWFGRLLRQTNLDEYPQFLNVLMGSMSTIGPRPHMVGEDRELAEHVNHYRMRRFVKPGITGLAAIKGYRGGTDDLDLMTKRTELDIWYLENWSLWLDIKIIAITIWQMATFRILKAY
jgi:putative colanic acid biosysnthesis UDP-glucose lipid carrier transferase